MFPLRSEFWFIKLLAQAKGRAVPRVEVPSLWAYSIKVVLALAVVLLIIFIFAYVFRKIRMGSVPFVRKKHIEVVEFATVMGKWGFAIIKAGRRLFLVGITEGSVQLISELDPKDLEEESFAKVLEENM